MALCAIHPYCPATPRINRPFDKAITNASVSTVHNKHRQFLVPGIHLHVVVVPPPPLAPHQHPLLTWKATSTECAILGYPRCTMRLRCQSFWEWQPKGDGHSSSWCHPCEAQLGRRQPALWLRLALVIDVGMRVPIP